MFDFSKALEEAKSGQKIRRSGWNGNGIFVTIQRPDENSKMSSPYLYIDTTGLQSDNENTPRVRTPWTPSQTDIMAEDWEVA